MHPSTDLDAMDREELVRLAGEQALLKQELSKLSAEQQRDLTALRNLPNDIGRSNGWHERGTQLLDRMHAREQQMAGEHLRLRGLSKLTGID